MQKPQRENEEKKAETQAKHKLRLVKATSGTLLSVGAAALITSIVYVSSILAFIGLSLVFWGAILLYIQPEEYAKKVLLDAAVLPSLATLNQIMQELNYEGKAIYLPPKYLKDPEANKIYIPKQKNGKPPSPELILKDESRLFIKNSQGILLTPPGAQLTKLFEKTLGTSFTKVDLEYLQQNLPKLLIEDLEIAEDIEIETKNRKAAKEITDSVSLIETARDTIHVKITNSILQDLWRENRKHSHLYSRIGCPICSAIACAITKAAGKPVIIEKIEISEDGKTTDAKFRLLGMPTPSHMEPTEEIESLAPTQLEEAAKLYLRRYLLPRLAGHFLIVSGSAILAWVGWLVWYDMTVWGKDIALIFFGSRTGEAISLGIGMIVVYYFILGLAFLLSGLIMFLRRRLETAIGLYLNRHLFPNLASLFLTVFGSVILAWAGWLVWYDMTVWGKDIALIFFGSRTGEAISLGIGMKVIYYSLIGLTLLLSGSIAFLRRRRKV